MIIIVVYSDGHCLNNVWEYGANRIRRNPFYRSADRIWRVTQTIEISDCRPPSIVDVIRKLNGRPTSIIDCIFRGGRGDLPLDSLLSGELKKKNNNNNIKNNVLKLFDHKSLRTQPSVTTNRYGFHKIYIYTCGQVKGRKMINYSLELPPVR